MLICPICGASNAEDTRFCTGCGKSFAVRGTGHDFTSGVMRYQPDRVETEEQPPVYLNRQALQALSGDVPAAKGAVSPLPPQQVFSPQPAVSGQGTPKPPVHGVEIPVMPIGIPERKPVQKKKVSAPVILLIALFAFLVLLIIFGVVVLLGGLD